MDTVTELSALATAYIGILQDLLANDPKREPGQDSNLPEIFQLGSKRLAARKSDPRGQIRLDDLWEKLYAWPDLSKRVLELVAPANSLLNQQNKLTETQHQALIHFAVQAEKLVVSVLQPLKRSIQADGAEKLKQVASENLKPYPTPEYWRRIFRAFLFQDPDNRLKLAEALAGPKDFKDPEAAKSKLFQPMLVRIVGAAIPEKLTQKQKLLKQKETKLKKSRQVSPGLETEVKVLGEEVQLLSEATAASLIKDDRALCRVLGICECAVPFDIVFRQELEEVNARRKVSAIKTNADPDPHHRADNLGLCGLAFSGGGIRSATFNLGILQALASAGWLPRFDYLSTVSGGSYLGSWLAAWVKRSGSQQKVSDRLCPNLSPEPRAEEVRPIRWLRMYSNYLAPNPSILSTDSWTLGVTWLRNTLLNTFIIVLALSALFALLNAFFHIWIGLPWSENFTWATSLVLLAAGTILCGLGMKMYTTESKWPPRQLIHKIVFSIVVVAMAGAFFMSGFLFGEPYPGFRNGYLKVCPIGVCSLIALLLVAFMGRYDRCFYGVGDTKEQQTYRRVLAWLVIIGASGVAVAGGLAALVLAWEAIAAIKLLPHHLTLITSGDLAQWYQTAVISHPPGSTMYTMLKDQPLAALTREKFFNLDYLNIAFALALPLLLEVIAITVVLRMALLGRNFPDERREWWGRMGAIMHLVAIGWLILATGALLSDKIPAIIRDSIAGKVAATGWLALVFSAVRFAYSARTPAQPDKPAANYWLGKLVSIGPYAFGLGLLILTAVFTNWLLARASGWLPLLFKGIITWTPPWQDTFSIPLDIWVGLVVCLVLAGLALLLGYTVDVNEFSLHHFYRNRLTRAYLGASRRRTERLETTNPFTSFDRRDEIKLCSLRKDDPIACHQPYDGPYLIINTTLNSTQVTDLAQQDRKAESFVFTPHYCGFDLVQIRAFNPRYPTFDFAYRPTQKYAYPDDNGPALGTAMTISGAAANPNRGYGSSPASAFLLTLFNARLGWWMGNPLRDATWQDPGPFWGLFYLGKDLFARAKMDDQYVNLSDGGHFDNMGLYELVRRRCRFIILGDGEEDQDFTCGGLANAIRRCRVDFGVEIKITVTPITDLEGRLSKSHFAIGTITYPDDLPNTPAGYLLYFKTSLTGDEPTDVREYAKENKKFPHQSTMDQFFNEAQFESYRRLGLHIAGQVIKKYNLGVRASDDLSMLFGKLYQEVPYPLRPARQVSKAT